MKKEKSAMSKVVVCAFVFLILVLVSAGVVPVVAATTWTVDTSGGADFTTIQAAVDAANEGDTIIVKSGTYYENVNVNKQLILRGIDTGGGKPVVDAGGSGSAITLSADGIMLEGFTATNSGFGIEVISSNNNITGNTVSYNNYDGIYLESSSNNTITGNTVTCNDEGIYLYDSSNNNITGNTVNNNAHGIYLDYSSNNTITGNTASYNNYAGICLDDSANNTITDNTATNNKNGISLWDSSRNIITANTVTTNNNHGIGLGDSSNNTIKSNTANNNEWGGIDLQEFSNYNTIIGNTANNNEYGIGLRDSSNNTINGNTANNNNGFFLAGINLYSYSNNNIITGNTANNNDDGIRIRLSSNNIITGNTASYNKYKGIGLYSSSWNNKIYINNYLNNKDNVYTDISGNFWNSPEEITYTYNGSTYTNYLGNYWSDYFGSDTDGDGIGDIPYSIDGDKDNYPLTKPIKNYFISKEPYTKIDVGVTSNIAQANTSDLVSYLPPEYTTTALSDSVVLNINVTDDTPENSTDDAYIDITINVGTLDVETCRVFKTGVGFLTEVEDITTRPTVAGDPAFSRDLVNNAVTVRLYTGNPLLGVVPSAKTCTDWPMFQRDLGNTGFTPDFGPTNNNVLWVVNLSGGASHPIVGRDHVFICNSSHVLAIDKNTGEIVWEKGRGGSAFSTSPAYSEGKLYVIGSGNGIIYCLNAVDGSEIWTKDISRKYIMPPKIFGDMVYFGGIHYGGPYAIQKDNGDVIWIDRDVFCDSLGYPNSWTEMWNSVAISPVTNKLYWASRETWTDGWDVYGTEYLHWSNLEYGDSQFGYVRYPGDKYTGPGPDVTPTIGGDHLYYITTGGILEKRSLIDLSLEGSMDIGTNGYGSLWDYAPAYHDGVLFVGNGSGLSAINTDTMTIKWTYGGLSAGSAVSGNGIVYFSTYGGKICAVNEEDGSLILQYNAAGSLAISGGILYVSSYDKLYAFGQGQAEFSDLTLSPDDITFSNPNPTVGETVTITATIHNEGNAGANNVVVQFFDGDPDAGGTQIGDNQTVDSISANGGMGTAQVDEWEVRENKYIYVKVDPDDSIPEANEENNYAVRMSIGIKEMIVRMVHIKSESDIDSLIEIAKDIGAEGMSISFKDDVNGKLFYESEVSWTETYSGYDGTLLSRLIEKCHENKIKAYAWIPIFNDPVLASNKPEWRMVDKMKGASDTFVSPVRSEVREHELAIIEEIVQNYEIDGVRLDWCRYDSSWQDWSEDSKQQFQDDTGINPEELQPGTEDWITWIDWRAEFITNFIEDAKGIIKLDNPNMEVGAYLLPFSARDGGYHDWSEEGQNYTQIGKIGLYVMPMVYWQDWTSRDEFEDWSNEKIKYSDQLSGSSDVVPVFSITRVIKKDREEEWGTSVLNESEVRMYLTRASQITRCNGINEISLFYYSKWGLGEVERAINSFSFSHDSGLGEVRPGTYTNYWFSEKDHFYNLDTYVTWEVAPSHGYIYPAFHFWFQVEEGGYIGTQLVGDAKKAIFSIWDTEDYSGTAQPAHQNCSRFGDDVNVEGTGTTCLIDYDWQEEREYRLRIWENSADNSGETWIASIYDTVTEQETVIGCIFLKNAGGYKGYGWLKNSASIFLEYFGGEKSCYCQPHAEVLWRGPFADNGLYVADSAVVPFYSCCPTNNVFSIGYPYVTHEAGGNVHKVTPRETELWSIKILVIIATCPVDLSITDPEGMQLSKSINEMSGAAYKEIDINGDGDPDDILTIPDRKIGDYQITVTPEPGAEPTDTYNLTVSAGDTTIVLAENVLIRDIPDRPYMIRSTEGGVIQIIPAMIDFDPDVLNLQSKGKWVTTYIELPEGYDVSAINISTVMLNDQVQAEMKPTEIGDYDDDGIVKLMVKFDWSAVQEILEVGDEVEIIVAGELTDGTPFEGSDVIRVIAQS